MKKILFFIDCLGSGGSQRQLVELAVGFKEKGYDVTILTYLDRNFYAEVLQTKDIATICIAKTGYLSRLFKLRKYIRSNNFDCVISFLDVPNFISVFSGLPFRKWKIIVGERSANPKILNSYRAKFYRKFFVFADAVVANSYANIEIVKKIVQLPENKQHVIYNIVDSVKWQPVNNYVLNENERFKVIIPASHRYLKNLKNVILGVSMLTEKEKTKLSIEWYGDNIDGNYFDNSYPEALELIEKLNLQDQFSFYSATHEIPAIVKNADTVGLFSFYEGLPNAVCEAMYAGKSVIASNISDVPLLISEKKLICDPDSPESVKNAFSYLLSCNSQELIKIGQVNRKKAVALFYKEKIINQYIDLIK